MIKYALIAILSLMFLQDANAQKKDTATRTITNLRITPEVIVQKNDTMIYCMMNNGQLAKSRKSADYFLFILPADTSSGATIYPVHEYYRNGHPKFSGYSSSNTYYRLKLEGPCTSYFPNGHKESKLYYAGGGLNGNATLYYPNGYLFTFEKYIGDKHLLIECRDSTGKTMAKDGNGEWLIFDNDMKIVVEAGPVIDSLQEGEWKENYLKGKNYVTVYHKGIVVSSTAPYRKPGEPIYAAVEEEPEFSGGNEAWNKFLKTNLIHPDIKGNVIVTFVVEKDGSLTNFQVLNTKMPHKPVDNNLTDEAIRIMKLSPPWLPGLQNGRRVRVSYIIALDFNLGDYN